MLSMSNDAEFKISSGMYVVKFWAAWCGPCKRMEPTIAQLESEFSTIQFISVDVDQVPDLAQKYKVKTLPTLLIFKDGVEVSRIIGLSLIEPLRKILRDLTR